MLPDSRHRTSSITRRPGMAKAQQPPGEATTSTFDESSHYYDPQLIAQITENVIKQLRMAKVPMTPPTPTSPQQSASFASHKSGQRDTDAGEQSSPKAPTDQSFPPPAPPKKLVDPILQMDSEERHQRQHQETFSPPRPEMKKAPTDLAEITPLERIWGSLFDDKGLPTTRLGQLWRGIANYIIEEYEPYQSIVITPEKMLEYYRKARLDGEAYPWHVLFDDEQTYVSRMYRDLSCQHHLVQEADNKRPWIPGLTPAGFSCWMTKVLLAHPDEEFERLKKVIVDMAIDNPDDKTERFPKDIPRRLFPIKPHTRVRNDLRRAMWTHSEHAKIDPPDEDSALFSDDSGGKSHLHNTRTSDDTRPRRMTDLDNLREKGPIYVESSPPVAEPEPVRQHVPTVGADGLVIPDDEHLKTSQPIERERKPYSATPGGGKMYDEPNGLVMDEHVLNGQPIQAASVGGAPSGNSQPMPMPRQPSSPNANNPFQQPSSYSSQSSGSRPTISRSSSSASRSQVHPPLPGPPPGPPPARASTHANMAQVAEIHQQPPVTSQRTPRGSHNHGNRRRAPSGSQTFPIPPEPTVTFAPASTDSRQPVYVERGADHDGYGAYDEEAGGRYRTNGPTGGVGKDGRDRRESPVRREWESSRRRSGDDGPREHTRYRD